MRDKFLESVDPEVLTYRDEARRVRRELHRIPEEGYREYKTQAYILNYLRELGLEPETVAETGVCVFLKGNKEGKTVALRADIDALPVTESNDLDYASEHEGFMHACGHDGHMTMLLVTAKFLKEHPEYEHRDLLLVFQPAEEGPGGAGKIIESGIFEKYDVSEIYGYHLFPFLEEGVIATTPGPMMAMTSEFYPVIKGKSAHAGHPEDGIDVLVAASEFVLAVQSIISRNVDPDESALINIGTLRAGERMNIVPGEAKLTGTLRSFNPDVQKKMKKRLEEILSGIDLVNNTESSINYIDMYPPVDNDGALFEKVWEVIPGEKERFKKVMLAEDFALYGSALPALFIGIGTGTDEYNADLHTSGFNFNEDVLLRGIDLYLKIGRL